MTGEENPKKQSSSRFAAQSRADDRTSKEEPPFHQVENGGESVSTDAPPDLSTGVAATVGVAIAMLILSSIAVFMNHPLRDSADIVRGRVQAEQSTACTSDDINRRADRLDADVRRLEVAIAAQRGKIAEIAQSTPVIELTSLELGERSSRMLRPHQSPTDADELRIALDVVREERAHINALGPEEVSLAVDQEWASDDQIVRIKLVYVWQADSMYGKAWNFAWIATGGESIDAFVGQETSYKALGKRYEVVVSELDAERNEATLLVYGPFFN